MSNPVYCVDQTKTYGNVEMKQKEEYTHESHVFVFCKPAGKQYCAYCGLVALNNDFTDWAVSKGCNYKLHSSYASARMKHTKYFIF